MWFDFRHYEEEKRKTKHKKKEKKINIEKKNEEQRTPHNWAYVFSTSSSNPNSLQTIMEYS